MNFSRISKELELQEMIFDKFLGNSSNKVTTVGESGEIPHFCYLLSPAKCESDDEVIDTQLIRR